MRHGILEARIEDGVADQAEVHSARNLPQELSKVGIGVVAVFEMAEVLHSSAVRSKFLSSVRRLSHFVHRVERPVSNDSASDT